MNLIRNNINAFLLVFVSILVSVFLGTLVENFRSLIVLAFGAKILALLVWGFYVIPGIFLAKMLQYVFFSSFDPTIESMLSLAAIATFIPVLTMYMLKISQAANLFNLESLDFRHIIFFVFITSILTSTFKYMYMMNDVLLEYNAAIAMINALFGQLFGGLLFVYVASKYAQPIYQILKKLKFA
ncbi:MAG: hypothetical protein NZ735_06105 [Candidatus Marinimicrobia bacterium]|nr:hypothetical protein [Candidatus Neomarinimicrobiota bacterium]